MFSVGTSLRLPVPIGRVWRLLVDIERYGDWHPTLRFTDRPGDDERVGYVYSPRGKLGPEFASEGRITGLDWLTGFSWRTGTRGLLVIEESYLARLSHSAAGLQRFSQALEHGARTATPSHDSSVPLRAAKRAPRMILNSKPGRRRPLSIAPLTTGRDFRLSGRCGSRVASRNGSRTSSCRAFNMRPDRNADRQVKRIAS